MNQEQIKKLVSFFFEVGNLRKVIRSHQQTLLCQDPTDNIASHSFRVALIGYFLAKNLNANADKVMKMCLLHDLEEVRTGDQNWVHRKYIRSFEDEVRKDQLAGLDIAEELKSLSKEYDEKTSLESKIVNDADLLDEIFLLREYEWQGNQEAKEWLNRIGGNSQQEKLMSTDLAREIAKEAQIQDPSNWWKKSYSSDKRK